MWLVNQTNSNLHWLFSWTNLTRPGHINTKKNKINRAGNSDEWRTQNCPPQNCPPKGISRAGNSDIHLFKGSKSSAEVLCFLFWSALSQYILFNHRRGVEFAFNTNKLFWPYSLSFMVSRFFSLIIWAIYLALLVRCKKTETKLYPWWNLTLGWDTFSLGG